MRITQAVLAPARSVMFFCASATPARLIFLIMAVYSKRA